MHQRSALALTIAAILWTGLLVASPAAISRPALAVPSATVYALSSRICHQRPERSFHLAGAQMPVCARCFGLYLAGAFGAVLAWGRLPRRSRGAAKAGRRVPGGDTRLVLALSAIPTAITWSLEASGIAAFSNLSRATAALPLGAVAGWVFVQMLRYDFFLNGQIDDSRSSIGRC